MVDDWLISGQITNQRNDIAAIPQRSFWGFPMLSSSFRFPSAGHVAAENFDPAYFAEVAARRAELPTLADLRFKAKGAMIGCESFCLMADDSIALVRVGSRGGKRVIWNFGNGAQ